MNSPRVKILVVCVDRDNDVGEKAGIKTPIVGEEESLSAVTKLALADPEDTDINAIFEGIRIYEELKNSGRDVEVVLIAGDRNVGVKSDEKIVKELDEVISKYEKDTSSDENVEIRGIIVTDGMEDEYVVPIIQSRMKIDSVRRVIVRQSEGLESSFYVIKKFFEDTKLARTFFLPLGLTFLTFSLCLLTGHVEWAVGLILGVVGTYMLIRGLGVEEDVKKFVITIKNSLYEGITLFTYICAFILFLIGTLQGIMGSWAYLKEIGYDLHGYRILLGAIYVKWAVWWYVVGVLFPLVGRMISLLLEKEKLGRRWSLPFFIIASGLVLWGGSECTIAISEDEAIMGYQILLFSMLAALILSFIGVGVSLYLRGREQEKEEGGAVREVESKGG
ncbi:MAG: DUF373 family protein [Candidatus Methanospirareceae archaeon]